MTRWLVDVDSRPTGAALAAVALLVVVAFAGALLVRSATATGRPVAGPGLAAQLASDAVDARAEGADRAAALSTAPGLPPLAPERRSGRRRTARTPAASKPAIAPVETPAPSSTPVPVATPAPAAAPPPAVAAPPAPPRPPTETFDSSG